MTFRAHPGGTSMRKPWMRARRDMLALARFLPCNQLPGQKEKNALAGTPLRLPGASRWHRLSSLCPRHKSHVRARRCLARGRPTGSPLPHTARDGTCPPKLRRRRDPSAAAFFHRRGRGDRGGPAEAGLGRHGGLPLPPGATDCPAHHPGGTGFPACAHATNPMSGRGDASPASDPPGRPYHTRRGTGTPRPQ